MKTSSLRERKKQWERFNAWERKQARRTRLTPHEAFRIFDALYERARAAGTWGNREAYFEHLAADIQMAAGIQRRTLSKGWRQKLKKEMASWEY